MIRLEKVDTCFSGIRVYHIHCNQILETRVKTLNVRCIDFFTIVQLFTNDHFVVDWTIQTEVSDIPLKNNQPLRKTQRFYHINH